MMAQTPFKIIPGRGAASGAREYRELGGSLAAQWPVFKQRGLDLSMFHRGTLNLDIRPHRFEIRSPLLTLTGIDWHPTLPAENFSFLSAMVEIDGRLDAGLIYYPRPETKGAFTAMPPDWMIEVLAPKIDGVDYGTQGVLHTDPEQIQILSS